MGTYVNSIEAYGAYIKEDRLTEFRERIEKLFQASGMMECEWIGITDEMEILDREDISWYHNKWLVLLDKAKMDDSGMNFTYNYFEDSFWENAGYSIRGDYVISNKTGGREFCQSVIAARFLQQLYVEGTSFVECGGEIQPGYSYIGWINYLFDEKYMQKNRDIWKLYETANYYSKYDYVKQIVDRGAKKIIRYDEDVLGYIEYKAVSGTAPEKETIRYYRNYFQRNGKGVGSSFDVFYSALEDMLNEFSRRKFAGIGELDVEATLDLMKTFYKSDIDTDDFLKMCNEKGLDSFGSFTSRYDYPAFAVEALAENYGEDFWTLWSRVKLAVNYSEREFPEFMNHQESEETICTQDFFEISDDDMILYWTCDGDIDFSVELKSWFIELRARYDRIVESVKVESKKKSQKWIVGLLDYATREYYHIYAFSDFFHETMDNLKDRRYIALWKLFEELLHDPELEKAGSVLFVSEGEGNKEAFCTNSLNKTRRRLKTFDLEFVPREDKFNLARVTYRRYMALVANKELRKRVFGF